MNYDLYSRWNRFVEAGGLWYRFPLENAALGLESGTVIETGLRSDEEGHPRFHAREANSGRSLNLRHEERRVAVGPANIVLEVNEVRAVRPGLTKTASEESSTDEIQCGFHCASAHRSLSLLQRRPLAVLTQIHNAFALYPNAFPVSADLHLMAVPCDTEAGDFKLPHLAQRFSPELLEDIMLLSQEAATEAVVFYNAVGAAATVDHFHVHLVARREPLPIELAAQNGVGDGSAIPAFPAHALVFDVEYSKRLMAVIRDLSERRVPYNLLLAAGRAFVVARRGRGKVAGFPGTPGALEMAGRFILTDPSVYEKLTAKDIRTILKQTTIPVGSP